MHIIRLRGGWSLMEPERRKIVNLSTDQSFLTELERRPRLQRKFQSPPQRSDAQTSWLCWSVSPALLELAFRGENLSTASGRIELPRDAVQHQIEILLERKASEIPEFWIEIQD